MSQESNMSAKQPPNEEEEKVKMEADYSSGGESDNEFEIIQIEVPKAYISYKLKPKVIGDNKITFYNAEDENFYERKLKDPILTVWLLSNDIKNKMLYSNKRFFEVGWRNNIQICVKVTYSHKYNLIIM